MSIAETNTVYIRMKLGLPSFYRRLGTFASLALQNRFTIDEPF